MWAGKKWDDGRSVPTRCRTRAARSRRTRVGLCVADDLDDASIRCLQPSRVGGIRGGIERPRQLLPNFRVAQAIACDGSRFRRGATNSDVATRDWPLDAFHVSRCVQPPLPPRAKTSPMNTACNLRLLNGATEWRPLSRADLLPASSRETLVFPRDPLGTPRDPPAVRLHGAAAARHPVPAAPMRVGQQPVLLWRSVDGLGDAAQGV